MLTKKLKFDDTVLNVIRNMDWKDDGKLGVIHQQLDRKLYVEVNKALTAMGGKWDRKRIGHVFPDDPRPLVEGLLENGHLVVERDGFFQTPLPVIERMFRLAAPHSRVLEPSAGMGAIAKEVRKSAAVTQLVCVEKNPQRAEHLRRQGFETFCEDFLLWQDSRVFDTVYMNPPFEENQDIRHIQRAYQHLKYNGDLVSVVSNGAFSNGTKIRQKFLEWLDSVEAHVEDLPEGSFKESGTMVRAKIVHIAR